MYELIINEGQTIHSLQELFHSKYPYLNIEFFSVPHDAGQPTSKKYMIANNKLIGELLPKKNKTGVIYFNDEITVAKLEEDFKKRFGLNVQIFRKSGRIWLEITNTDNWTLLQQNEEGKSFEQDVRLEQENSDDHDIY